jgi:hypothetical protein
MAAYYKLVTQPQAEQSGVGLVSTEAHVSRWVYVPVSHLFILIKTGPGQTAGLINLETAWKMNFSM